MKDVVNAIVQIAKLVEIFMETQNKPASEKTPDPRKVTRKGK